MRKLFLCFSLLVAPSTAVVWAQTSPPDQQARYERADASTKKTTTKLKWLGLAALQYAYDHNKQLDMGEADFSQKLRPYVANESAFYADTNQKQKFSFNAITARVDWEKFRFQEAAHKTVLFYEGKDKQLSFNHDGFALANVASGEVLIVTKEEAKSLLWDVPADFKK